MLYKKTHALFSRAQEKKRMAEECTICLDGEGALLRKGCACRGSIALAHAACSVRAACAQLPHRGELAWSECQTCGHLFTGEIALALGEAWLRRGPELDCARSFHATGLMHTGAYAEAELVFRDVLAAHKARYGPTHKATMQSAGRLASALWHQKKFAEAETLRRNVAACRAGTLGAAHPLTLVSESELALALSSQDKFAEAARLFESTLAAQTLVLGHAHEHTLVTASNYASMMLRSGDGGAAEPLYRAAVVAHSRVLGDLHPNTMLMCSNLAMCVARQDRRDEAREIYDRTVSNMREVLGEAHPDTVRCARHARDLDGPSAGEESAELVL